jgi:hypothetical protein
MAQELNHLPHIKNMQAGINKWDPVQKAIFEVYFTLPQALQEISTFQQDSVILTQQVTNVGGLDALQKTTAAGEQKFYGTTVSFLNPTVDTTAADLTMTLNLNLRNVTDNYVLKIFRAWEDLSYDLQTGARGIKTDYIVDDLRIAEANRNGQIWRSYIFHHVMLTGVTGLEDLDYSANDPRQLQISLRADFWDDEMA